MNNTVDRTEQDHRLEDALEAIRLALAALNHPTSMAATRIREARAALERVTS